MENFLAVVLARHGWHFPKTELVKALAETAIACYRVQGLAGAFQYLDEAVSLLFESKTDTESWRDLHVLVAHTVGFYTSMATMGRRPQGVTADGEAYAEPALGIFLKYHRTRHLLHEPGRESLLKSSMALLANALDDDARCVFWTKATILTPTVSGPEPIVLMFDTVDLIRAERFEEAVGHIAELPNATAAIMHLLLVAAVALAHTWLDSPSKAAHDARMLAVCMRALVVEPKDAELWTLCADLIEQGFDPMTDSSLVKALLRRSGGNDVVLTAGLLALTLREDQPAANAASAHVRISKRLLDQQQIFMPLHRRLLLPFMFEYWQSLTARSGFLFRTPSEVRTAIAAAAGAPTRTRAQRLLREVVSGLGLTVPTEIKAWLNES